MLPKSFIDPPSPYAPLEELTRFLETHQQRAKDDPFMAKTLDQTRKYLDWRKKRPLPGDPTYPERPTASKPRAD